jgi:hypothetical protein
MRVRVGDEKACRIGAAGEFAAGQAMTQSLRGEGGVRFNTSQTFNFLDTEQLWRGEGRNRGWSNMVHARGKVEYLGNGLAREGVGDVATQAGSV